jgi:tape measure domain-containing protein
VAVRIGSLFVSLGADTQPFVQGMSRAESTTTRVAGNIARHAGVAEASVNRFSRSMGTNFRPYGLIAVSRAFDNAADRAALFRGALLSTTAVFGGFTAALSSNLLLRFADSFTNLNNQIRVVSNNSADAAARFEDIQQVANRSRSSLEATAVLYSRIQKAAPDVGSDKVLEYVETIQKALVLGGATAQEARSAALQFSQAIASNRLGGEELRAILETPLGLELARGLGVTIGKMREMATAGELTADKVLGALTAVKGSVDQQFARSISTVDQALTLVDNKLVEYIGKTDKAYGVTRLLATGIAGFGNNLETILPLVAQLAGGLATVFLSRKLVGAGSNFLGGIKEQSKAAKDQVLTLRDSVGKLQTSLINAEMERSRLARSGGQVGQFADPSVIKGYERANFQLQKLDQAHLELLEKRRTAITELANVTASVSPKIAKITQDQVTGETRLVELQKERALLFKNMTGMSGQHNESIGRSLRAGWQEEAKIRDQMASRAQQIAALESNAARTAANQRIAALKQVAVVEKQIADSSLNRQIAVFGAREAGGDVSRSGSENLRRNLNGQVEMVRGLQQQLQPLAAALSVAEKQATGTGIAMQFLRRQGAAVVGLFGGPWGIALTAAIGIMGYLGISAQANAQKIANAQKLIDDALERAEQVGGGGSFAARTSNASRAQEKLREDLKLVQEEFERVVNSATVGLDRITGGLTDMGQSVTDSSVTDAVRGLINQLTSGAITSDKFRDAIKEMAKTTPELKPLAAEVESVALKIERAFEAIQKFNAEIEKVGKVKAFTDTSGFDEVLRKFDKDQYEFKGASQEALEIAKAEAAGNTIRANALRAYNALVKEGKIVTFEQVYAQQLQIHQLGEQAGAFQKAKREAESFQERLKRLKEEGQGAFLGDIDRQVLEMARSLKAPAEQLKAYVDAARSGNFSGVSPKFMEIRDLETLRAAGQVSREVVQTYGTWSQIAPLAAQQQQILNTAVENGVITAYQAKIAFADFLGQFGNYQWINQTADAFGQFIHDAVDGTGSLDDAVNNLRKTLQRLAIEELAAKPIKDFLRSGLASLASGLPGMFGPGSGVLPGGLPIGAGGIGAAAKGAAFGPGGVIPFAKGGVVNRPTLFPFARGTGLMGEAGAEAILPLARGRDGNLGVRMSGMADSAGSVTNNFIVENHTDGKVSQRRERNASGGVDHRVVIKQAAAEGIAEGSMDNAMASRFGITPSQSRR